MKIALIEPFAGIAGDMLTGALLHAGAPLRAVRAALKGFRVATRNVLRGGIAAKKFVVSSREASHHRGLNEILALLKKIDLAEGARDRAAEAFRLLAEAEARIHRVPVDEVRFHEVGAVDSICDIVGAATALDALGIEQVYCRALPLSTGSVNAAHGRLPLPAPATLELIRGLETYDSGLEGELVTPTGAAMVAAWAKRGAPPPFSPQSIGYGAGDRDPEGYPNVCRVVVGETLAAKAGGLFQLVCDVDDATAQVLGNLLDRLLEAGALDATLQPLVMKKNRPGTRVTVLARTEAVPVLERVLRAPRSGSGATRSSARSCRAGS
jgi:uncharacterized protein (TIGR00299 family) protein